MRREREQSASFFFFLSPPRGRDCSLVAAAARPRRISNRISSLFCSSNATFVELERCSPIVGPTLPIEAR